MESHPYCANPFGVHVCPVPARIVDHIVPLRAGGKDDESNYQSLCWSCHVRKTALDGSDHERHGGMVSKNF